MCVCNWVSLLYSRDWYNIVNLPYFNLKKKKKERKSRTRGHTLLYWITASECQRRKGLTNPAPGQLWNIQRLEEFQVSTDGSLWWAYWTLIDAQEISTKYPPPKSNPTCWLPERINDPSRPSQLLIKILWTLAFFWPCSYDKYNNII